MYDEIAAVDLIKAFSQGEIQLESKKKLQGNSACIAIIKASIEIFGLNNIIQYNINDNIYTVTLKNGFQLTFSQQDLERCNYVSNFQLNAVDPGKITLYKKIFDLAQLLMCTMVKVVCEINKAFDGDACFEKALLFLNDAPNAESLPFFLGLENYFVGKSPLERFFMSSKNKGMVAWLNNHAVFVSEEIYDYYGKVYFKTKWWYPKRIKIVTKELD